MTSDGGSTWTLVSPVPTITKTYYLTYAKNDSTTFITGNNSCLQRLKSGVWSSVIADAGSGGYNTWCMSFVPPIDTSKVGWLVGDAGTIKKTIDGGTTWNIQTSVVLGATTLRKIQCLDKDTFVIVGFGGKIFRTIDAGTNWTSITSGVTDNLRSLQFINMLEGWAVGENSAILHTIDGGRSWTKVTTVPATGKVLREVFFVSAKKGFVTGNIDASNSYLWMTEDGGATWTSVWVVASINNTKSIWFLDDVTGFLCANDKIFKTISGGKVPALSAPATATLTDTANSKTAIALTATGYWTAKSSDTWLVISDTIGKLNDTIIATANTATAVTRSSTITFKSNGLADKVVTVTQESTVSTNSLDVQAIVISPNPASDYVQIQNLPSNCNVVLYNLAGAVVLSQSINSSSVSLNIAALAKGVYIIELKISAKVIKKQMLVIE